MMTCTIRASYWPITPQIDRRHPSFSEFDIVLIVPAPGVKLITRHAASSDSHVVQVIPSVYLRAYAATHDQADRAQERRRARA